MLSALFETGNCSDFPKEETHPVEMDNAKGYYSSGDPTHHFLKRGLDKYDKYFRKYSEYYPLHDDHEFVTDDAKSHFKLNERMCTVKKGCNSGYGLLDDSHGGESVTVLDVLKSATHAYFGDEPKYNLVAPGGTQVGLSPTVGICEEKKVGASHLYRLCCPHDSEMVGGYLEYDDQIPIKKHLMDAKDIELEGGYFGGSTTRIVYSKTPDLWLKVGGGGKCSFGVNGFLPERNGNTFNNLCDWILAFGCHRPSFATGKKY